MIWPDRLRRHGRPLSGLPCELLRLYAIRQTTSVGELNEGEWVGAALRFDAPPRSDKGVRMRLLPRAASLPDTTRHDTTPPALPGLDRLLLPHTVSMRHIPGLLTVLLQTSV